MAVLTYCGSSPLELIDRRAAKYFGIISTLPHADKVAQSSSFFPSFVSTHYYLLLLHITISGIFLS
jgi:hypothetical protein